MQSVGAYAFVTKDWKELEYPLDLWLPWTASQFDQVSLVIYGDVEVPKIKNDNIKITKINKFPSGKYFDFYLKGKTLAQEQLETDWKVLLDIDEFMFRPNLGTAISRYVYPLRYYNLYGSLEYRIKRKPYFATRQYRIHYGNKQITGDGANVFSSHGRHDNIAPRVWHVNATRSLEVMQQKWVTQTRRELNEGYYANLGRLKIMTSNGFKYENYKKLFPGARLSKMSLKTMPKILLENKERFNRWKP